LSINDLIFEKILDLNLKSSLSDPSKYECFVAAQRKDAMQIRIFDLILYASIEDKS